MEMAQQKINTKARETKKVKKGGKHRRRDSKDNKK